MAGFISHPSKNVLTPLLRKDKANNYSPLHHQSPFNSLNPPSAFKLKVHCSQYMTTLPPQHMTSLSPQYVNTLPPQCIITLPLQDMTILPPQDMTTPPPQHMTSFSPQYVNTLPPQCIITLHLQDMTTLSPQDMTTPPPQEMNTLPSHHMPIPICTVCHSKLTASQKRNICIKCHGVVSVICVCYAMSLDCIVDLCVLCNVMGLYH